MFIDEGVEMQFLESAEDSGDMAVRAGADDVESLRERGADGSGAFQDGAEGVELSGRPMGNVGEGTVADFAVKPKGLAEENGGRGVAVGDGGYVHAYILSQYYRNSKTNHTVYMTT
jgi:hypothetical protein